MSNNKPFITYEEVKEKLFITITNIKTLKAQEEEIGMAIPHQTINDLCITYHIYTSKEPIAHYGYTSVLVTENIMKMFGIDERTLHEDAMQNAPKLMPYKLTSLSEAAFGLPNEDEPTKVLTTSVNCFGASAIFYPDLLEEISEKFGPYYILPSSVHEVILVKQDFGEVSSLRMMVESINKTDVRVDDWLSDNVYYYDGKGLRVA